MYEDLTNDDIIAQINNLKASIYKIEYDNHGATDKEIFESDMFRILVENSLDYIAVTKFDIKLTIEYLSPSYQKILNYDISKFIGESKFVFVHPEDKVDLFPKLRRYLIEKFKTIFGKKMREVSERVEYRLKDDQGGFRYVDSIAFNFEDKIYFVGRDITNYVKAQRALQEIKTRFLIAAQSSNALIYEWDIASNKFHWIGDIDGALSYDEGEIERSFDAKTDLLHPDDKHRYMIAIDNLESTGEEFSIEYRIEDKNGDYRYWVEKAKGILNMNRESIRLVGVCRDITEQKNKEKSLLAQIANLEKYNESMSDRGYRIVELEHNIESLEKDFEKLKKRKIKEQD